MKELINKIRKSRIFSLICILLFISICFGIGAAAAYINHESDPTDVASNYFRAFVAMDYNKMYSYIDKEDAYVEKTLYTKKMENLRKQYTIDSYDINKPETKDGQKSVTIKCKNDETGKTKDFVVKITSKRKGLNIVPDFYVNIDDILTNNFQVTLPAGNELQLNGITITNSNAKVSKNSSGQEVYLFNKTLKGNYKAVATNAIYAMVKTLNVSKDNTKLDLSKFQLVANDNYTKIINKNCDSLVDQFYKAVRTKDSKRKELLKLFSTKKTKNKVSSLVDQSMEITYPSDDRNVSKLKVIDMKINKKDSKIVYNKKNKEYTLTYKYSYSYVSSTDTSLTSSYIYSISGKCDSQLTVVYTADKNQVKIKNIKLKNKDKKSQ